MAEASISVDQDQFICPVCLDLLKDPVTVPCGHSFCKVCINDCWDQEDQKGVYSCPQCRDTFTPRPVLRKNNMLAEVVEKLKKKTEVQAASPDHCYAGPGDVECDFCTGRKHKAIKSCLVCVASFCEIHLKPHLEIPGMKKHTLTEASAKLQEKICSEHDEVLKIYCRTDQISICSLCMLDKHKGHDAVSVTAGRAEKQSELKEQQMKSQQRIQEKQKKVQELKQAVNTIKLSSQTAVEDSEKIFTDMISSMEKKRSEVMEMIRAQEEAELSRAERLLEELEQEITDLQRRVTELEQLLHTHDHIHFLQSFQSLCVSAGRQSPPGKRPDFHTSSITVHQHHFSDGMRKYFSDLKKRLEEFCEEEFNKIPAQDSCYLTLDPNTAHRNLILFEKNRAVGYDGRKQQISDHPERFDYWPQVLCKESVCGRCYWEEDQKGVYSCPQCRDTFTPRPVLHRNNMLAEVVEKLKKKKKTEVQTASPDYCYAGPGDVECDFCTGRKHKAVKSCLSELKEQQMKSQQRIQEKQKKVQELKQAVNTIKLSAQTAVEDTERIFTELISSIEKKRLEVMEMIRAQEEAELSRAERLLEQLEQEIADLQRKVTELEQLSHTHDHIHFLQEDQKSIYSCPQCRDTFTPRPVLRRNNMLAEVVEKLKKKTEVQAASSDHCYAGPGDVECDFCTGRKHKAAKSCLSELKEQMKSQQKIQEKQKKVQELKQAVNTIKVSSEKRRSCS
ncbi:finTRIM family, member 14 [Silurus asotus]|uniref:FinTRIM family, member 14 n=1 Tax=Silurus asotus TaxID=30991 RepID=A0AAD5A0G5_SILAS|nr:finTRIM family, member 14 [Silurus asotus]